MPGAPTPPVLRTLRLSNGIRVDLVANTEPTIAQAAVCYSDEHGSSAGLAELVLHAAGLSVDVLRRRFGPPAFVVTEGRFPVLVVVSSRRTWPEDAGIRANLGAGLDLLAELPAFASLWVPLIETGEAGLAFEQSAAFIVDALSRWDNRNSTRKVLLAAPSDEAARAVEQYRALELTPVTPGRSLLEAHVDAALAAAYKFSGGLVDAPSVLRAVVALAGRNKGTKQAFQAFAELLPRRDAIEQQMVQTHGSLSELKRPETFRMQRPLADTFAQAARLFPDRMWGRHLVTAALLSAEAALEPFAREAGTTLPVLRRRWYQFLAGETSHPVESWDRWWREAGLSPPLGLHAGYQPDAARGEDQLGLEAHLEAFARLITDDKVGLPLSIGLLGDWGSGKSFFLDLLERRIEGLEGSAGHCGNVVQIRFNAWTFSDANLWAGLVEQILERVWKELVPEKSSKEVREELQKAIEVANGAVHEANAQVGLAQVALEEANATLNRRLESLAVTAVLKEQGKQLLEEAVKLARAVGWQQELKTIVDVDEARQALDESSERLRRTAQTALRNGLGWRWLLIGIGTGATLSSRPLVEWLSNRAGIVEALVPIARTLGWIAGILGSLLEPLRRATKQIDAFGGKLASAQASYRKALASAKMSADSKERAVAEQAEKSRTELASAQASLESAKKRLADLLDQHAAQDPVRRLSSYLQERVGDYRTRQGIISLVRKDFENLARLMTDWRQDSSKAPTGVRPIDRIVLYVDDLDRCAPALVVQALEAVHLLLALDLFVVVVAVDSRWLLRSLEVHYDQLLGKSRMADGLGASPQHYLEKIFQITFALAPMTEDGYERYIEHLTRADGGVRPAAPPPPPVAAPPPISSDQTNLPPIAGPRPADPAPLPPPAPEPTRLTIHPHESDLMKRLHPLVPSPRTAKRLVNVFRLYKAALPPRAADDFEVANTGGYRPTLILLALLQGRPDLARALYSPLCTGARPFDRLQSSLAEALKNWDVPAELASEAEELHDLVNQVAPDLKLRECLPVARELARYSLITGPWWHSFTRPQAHPLTSVTDGERVGHPPPEELPG